MIAHYTTGNQTCEYCGGTIYVGQEAFIHDDGFFCDETCGQMHFFEGSGARMVYLTDNKLHRSVD